MQAYDAVDHDIHGTLTIAAIIQDSFVHELMVINHPGGRDLRQLDVIMDDTADSIALISVLCAILMHAADV